MLTKTFSEKVMVAGFGGQGVMLAGKLLAHTAMRLGYEVTYMPSYGAEVRGGTANCMVIFSSDPIACPLVNQMNVLIALNKASLDKFVPRLPGGGLLILNSSLIDQKPLRKDIEIISVPADDIAVEITSPRSTNMVALGAYLEKCAMLPIDIAADSLAKVLASRYHSTLPANKEALYQGAEFVQKTS